MPTATNHLKSPKGRSKTTLNVFKTIEKSFQHQQCVLFQRFPNQTVIFLCFMIIYRICSMHWIYFTISLIIQNWLKFQLFMPVVKDCILFDNLHLFLIMLHYFFFQFAENHIDAIFLLRWSFNKWRVERKEHLMPK